MKRTLKIVGIVVAILIVILIALPFFINVNSFRPKLEATASEALGRQVKVGNLSLSILSGSVSADNISIAEDPAFGNTPFVTAKSLKVGVELMPLLTSKELRVTDITLEQPQITLLKTADGKWNFSSLGGKASEKSSRATKFWIVCARKPVGRQAQRERRKADRRQSEILRQASHLRSSQHHGDEVSRPPRNSRFD